MSYDMWFTCPCCERTLEEVGITYNHSATYTKVYGNLGVRSLYGKPAPEVFKYAMQGARSIMSIEGAEEYEEGWEPTKRNAMLALLRLATAAAKCPDNAILTGD